MTRETILVVDDSLDFARTLERYTLAPLGYQVLYAANGQSGLQLAVSRQPDLILLDMNMPAMSGMEMLRALRQTSCTSPVIFMTMHGSESIAVDAFRLGVRDYLVKPFAIEEAQQAVDRALREKRLVQEKEEHAQNLLMAETVRRTVVTLSHYINNYLTALSGNLSLLAETLPQENRGDLDLSQILQEAQDSSHKIAAVLRVLQQVTNVEQTTYHGPISMIDIEKALREELAKWMVR